MLSISALSFSCVCYGLSGLFVAAIVGAGLQMTLKRWQASRILSRLNGKHVLITGGSQGIGRSMAALCCRYGADVTLFARDPIKLHETKAQLVACHRLHDKQKLNCFSVDVTSPEQVDKTMLYMAEHFDAVDILINCAGNSIPGSVDETSLDIYDRMMAVNYFGSLYTTKSLIPLMKQRQSGHIVFVSSIAGLFGMYGFSAYSAAKFAVIGLAESLHMELKEHGVAVTVVLPPDTDTPGFEQEQLTKPLETKLISEAGGLCKPDEVAEKALKDILMRNFTSTIGFENYLVCLAASGCFPADSWAQLFLQSLAIGPCKLIFGFFLISCQRIVRKCKNQASINRSKSD